MDESISDVSSNHLTVCVHACMHACASGVVVASGWVGRVSTLAAGDISTGGLLHCNTNVSTSGTNIRHALWAGVVIDSTYRLRRRLVMVTVVVMVIRTCLVCKCLTV
jgi:sulfite reductase beta subunit-like hemoprotein